MIGADDSVQVTIEGQMITTLRSTAELMNQPALEIEIDGRSVSVPRVTSHPDSTGRAVPFPTTIYDAALQAEVDIPTLCHREYMKPVGVCRVCSVEVKFTDGRKEWRLAPACYRPVEQGMVVSTRHTSERVRSSVKTLTQLLMADHPSPCAKQREHGDCELERYAREFLVPAPWFARSPEHRHHDDSSVVIAVDHNACILCDRCIRGCNDIRGNEVLGRRGKGYQAGVAFDLDTPMGSSTCVSCGECMVSCPTGALTNRACIQPKAWEKARPPAQPVPAEELATLELFQGVALPFLHWNKGAVVRRRFKKGDVICREGEFGSTAFFLESGCVKVFIQAPLKHVKGRKGKADKVNWGPLGLIRRFTTGLARRREDNRSEESTTRYIHIDAPVSLDYDHPVATLGAGELFGEMTCMCSYPRSATVQAVEDCTVLEMLRNVLYIVQRSKASRAMFEARYRQRAVDNHLRSVPIFADILDDEADFRRFVDFLRERVDLIRINPGQVIFRQGDAADHFYLVRIGFIKVAQNWPGGERVLRYIGPGGYFGEIGLMSHLPELRALAPPGVRTATCSSIDHVDLVRLKGQDFLETIQQFPQVRQRLLEIAADHLKENEQTRLEVSHVPLGDFLKQGLMNAQSLLVLDLEKCTRCDECTKACADAHDGITRLIREGLRFDKYLVASSCRSCLDPYCMVGCPVGSIRRRHSREIIIEDWCIGCGKCADNCPYGNINMHPFNELRDDQVHTGQKVAVTQYKATTCDLCVGLDGQPSCVYACPHDAAHRMSGPELLRGVETERA
jgi:CRP-like cAMP-binding protein/Fe-S-cluster-containing hydrogenase component 2